MDNGMAAPVATARVAPEPSEGSAPMGQTMSRMDFTAMNGVVIRQETQVAESVLQVVGIPFEAKNRYVLSALPVGQRVATYPTETGRYRPSGTELKALPQHMRAHEESGACERIVLNACGCGNLRNLKLHFFDQGGNQFVQYRPFVGLGAGCCCPVESTLFTEEAGKPQQPIGRVREDCAPCSSQWCERAFQLCCFCTFYQQVDVWDYNQYTPKYKLRLNVACCGRTNNCCGATCLRNDAVFDILDMDGRVVAHIQKTYGGDDDCFGALCRMAMQFSNYAISFPEGTSHQERALIVAAVMHSEYLLFEKKGNE